MKATRLAILLSSLLSAIAAPVPEPIEARASCAPVYVVYARGTTELPPIGSVVGPAFSSELSSLIPGVQVVGVTYSASIAGYLEGGDPAGISNAESLVTAYAAQCPSAKIVISGYSQGAQIAHKALEGLAGSSAFSHLKAIVTWGDPFHTQSTDGVPFQYYCNAGDLICADTDIVTPAHLLYGINGDAADGAQWVAKTLGY